MPGPRPIGRPRGIDCTSRGTRAGGLLRRSPVTVAIYLPSSKRGRNVVTGGQNVQSASTANSGTR